MELSSRQIEPLLLSGGSWRSAPQRPRTLSTNFKLGRFWNTPALFGTLPPGRTCLGLMRYRGEWHSFGLHRYHNTCSGDNMLQTLSWPTPKQRRKSARLSMMYKVTNKLAKAQSPELKFKQHSWLSHGHDQRYRQHSSRTEHRRTSLFPGTGRDRNSLSKRQSRSPSLTPSSGGCQAPHLNQPSFLS